MTQMIHLHDRVTFDVNVSKIKNILVMCSLFNTFIISIALKQEVELHIVVSKMLLTFLFEGSNNIWQRAIILLP